MACSKCNKKKGRVKSTSKNNNLKKTTIRIKK